MKHESVFQRAKKDTLKAITSLVFWVFEVIFNFVLQAVVIFLDLGVWVQGLILLLGLLGFIGASFLFYAITAGPRQRDELIKTLSEKESEIAILKCTGLRCKARFASFRPLPDTKQVILLAQLDIRNSGGPTSGTDFQISIELNGQKYQGELFTIAKRFPVTASLKIEPKQLLLSGENPYAEMVMPVIPKGGTKSGWVLGLLNESAAFEALTSWATNDRQSDVILEVRFSDVKGNEIIMAASLKDFLPDTFALTGHYADSVD